MYLPNGNPAPGPKFNYKPAWFNRLIVHSGKLIKFRKQVILAGDFNAIPAEKKDVYKPERWVDDALFRPETGKVFKKLLARGWTDAVRKLFPDETIYSFWDYFRNTYGRNAGLRIDHFLLSPSIEKKLLDAGVDRYVHGWGKTCDHAPVWIGLEIK